MRLLAAALLPAACHLGSTAANYQPAKRAEGATLVITTDAGGYKAELLEVGETGVVVLLSEGRVAFVPWGVTRSARAEGVPSLTSSYGLGVPPSDEVRKNLASVSHFPQGMTADIQARFLAAHGQSGIVTLR